MPFRLRRDARDWFRDISDVFELDFDMYFLCLMAGLSQRRKVPQKEDDTTKLVPNFPGNYSNYSRVIVATFLTAELEELNVSGDDRSALNSSVDRLVDPTAQAHLSTEGLNAINMYSYGGFDCLTEWFNDRPYSFAAFYPRYFQKINDAFDDLPTNPL